MRYSDLPVEGIFSIQVQNFENFLWKKISDSYGEWYGFLNPTNTELEKKAQEQNQRKRINMRGWITIVQHNQHAE